LVTSISGDEFLHSVRMLSINATSTNGGLLIRKGIVSLSLSILPMGYACKIRILIGLIMVFPLVAYGGSITVGDIEISPEDFSPELGSEKRIAKCLSCHGNQAGGDIDFGANTHFGTPSLRGMRESYLKVSLNAYKTGTRMHKEMSAIASLLDEETIDFMARSFSTYEVPPMRSADELTALAEKDLLFTKGQTLARQGIPQKGVPACIACHGPLGEGSDIGPRLAGQNVMYIKSQIESFANGARRTVQSAIMQPVVAGLMDDDIEAVAHYYESVQEQPGTEEQTGFVE
jgi:cytochrome c553